MSTSPLSLPVPAPDDLADLGYRIDRDGLDAHLAAVRTLVRTARGLGISPVLCQVSLDPTAPDVVRERAVARLIRRVCAVTDLVRHQMATATV